MSPSGPQGRSNDEIGARKSPATERADADGEVTRLLASAARHGRVPVDEVIPLVYAELRRMAHGYLRGERSGHTVNTTALVHEAYVKLAALDRIAWRDRSHFLAMAARAMRRVLIDYALARKACKRDGGARVTLDADLPDQETPVEDLLAVDAALDRLARLNARLAQVVECRYFAGMSIEETAQALAASPATVKRDWSVARAWLHRELSTD